MFSVGIVVDVDVQFFCEEPGHAVVGEVEDVTAVHLEQVVEKLYVQRSNIRHLGSPLELEKEFAQLCQSADRGDQVA